MIMEVWAIAILLKPRKAYGNVQGAIYFIQKTTWMLKGV
jgi:hypothetical protein